MGVYFALAGFVLVAGRLVSKAKKAPVKIALVIVVCLAFCLVTGARSLEVGTDTSIYPYRCPSEAHVADAEVQMLLSAGEKSWAEKAVETARMRGDGAAYAELVREAGFDADDTARQVADMLGR